MKTVTANTLVYSLVCIAGLIGFIAGLFISWLPAFTIYLGYGIFAVGLFGVICSMNGRRWRTILAFMLSWAAGILLLTMFYIPVLPIIMFYTSPVHLPLLGSACRVAKRDDRGRHIAKLFHGAAFILALVLPHFMMVDLRKPYPLRPEPIEVSADSIEDKRPVFIDDRSMWFQDTLQGRYPEEAITYRVNKSAAVIRLGFAKLTDREKACSRRLFATYGRALSYAKRNQLAVIPSVQMIDHNAKVFADKLYAAIERHMQSKAPMAGGGKSRFLAAILAALLEADDTIPGRMEAMAYLAAGLHLGGQEHPPLPPEAESLRAKLESKFLSEPSRCKPVRFYAESDELKQIFQQDRFYQTPLIPTAAIALAKVMADHPDLDRHYRSILTLYARLTNPPSRFSVADLADYAESFDDPSLLLERMRTSSKGRILSERSGGRGPGDDGTSGIQFLPHATSKENQLFARLYNVSADLPGHNIMNRLIRAIRSGELDLAPAADGGWYDYQMFALETLLVPEKGQEGDKLLLSEDYKKRLIDAFKTMLTKKRELHVRHIEFVPARCMVLGPEYFSISPDLHVEPMATYCLRTARGFRFLLDGLETILGSSSLEGIVVDGSSLPAALEEMASLYYGLYLQICEDIGMRPQFLPDEMTDAQEAQAREQTGQWLLNYEKESFCQKDVRYIVPALTNLEGTRVRYWMVVGVALLKIRADYARRPQIQIINAETAEILQQIPTDTESGRIMDTYLRYRYGSEEYFLPVEVFAEATGPAEPLTREEFRRLCDRCRDKDKIIAAIESRAAFTILRVVIIALLAFLLGAAVLVLVHLVKRKRSASPLPPGENETAGDEHRGG